MAEKQDKSGTKKASSKSKKSTKNGFLEILGDSRTRTISGVFLVIVSAFLTLAFVSYLIDGPADQSAVQELSDTLADPDQRVNNWMGKFGAGVAEQFLYDWFGVTAFLFPFLFLIIGLKVLFRKTVVPIGRAIKHSLFFLYLLPLTMGFLVQENFSLSGGLGYQLHRWTSSFVGSTGTALIILFLSVIYLSVVFNLSVDGIKKLFSSKPKEAEANSEVDEDGFTPVADITVKTNELDLKDKPEPKPIPVVEPTPEPVIELEPMVVPTPEPVVDAPTLDASPVGENIAFEIEKAEVEEETVAESDGEGMGEYDPTLDLSHYKKPGLDLLEAYGKVRFL